MSANVGDNAPGFTLKRKTADGFVDVSLSDFKGESNVVLLFFPLVFSTVCCSLNPLNMFMKSSDYCRLSGCSGNI